MHCVGCFCPSVLPILDISTPWGNFLSFSFLLIRIWWSEIEFAVTSWCLILVNTIYQASRDFLQIWLEQPLGHKDELIRIGWSNVSGQGHCDHMASRTHEHHISRTPWGNFFKFGANSHLEKKDELIRIWWWKVSGLGHCDLTKHILAITEQFVWWLWQHFTIM